MPHLRHLGLALLLAFSSTSTGGIFEDPENLDVLPEDISPEELRDHMRGWAGSLGVRCGHCHVGEPDAPLEEYDFASDEKDAKMVSRAMYRMVQAINQDHIHELDGDEPRLAVNCATCHSGKTKPWTLAQRMDSAYRDGGSVAALTEYADLRASYFGGAQYDFSEDALIAYATSLYSRGDVEGAAAVLETNLEHHPGSADTHLTLAQVVARSGDRRAALEHARNALELAPDDPRAARLLQQLEGG